MKLNNEMPEFIEINKHINEVLAEPEIRNAIDAIGINEGDLKEQLFRNAEDKIFTPLESDINKYKDKKSEMLNVANEKYLYLPNDASIGSVFLSLFLRLVVVALILMPLSFFLAPKFPNLKTSFFVYFGVAIVISIETTLGWRRFRKRAARRSVDIAKLAGELSILESIIRTNLNETALKPYLRELINDRIQDSYNTKLDIDHAPGLSEVFTAEFEIGTRQKQKIIASMKRMPGGSIGISGPRGIGKSTLIRSVCDFCDKEFKKPVLSIMISAPVKYNGREFLLYLFTALAQKYLTKRGKEFKLALQYEQDDETRRENLFKLIRPYRTYIGFVGSLLLTFGMFFFVSAFKRYSELRPHVELETSADSVNHGKLRSDTVKQVKSNIDSAATRNEPKPSGYISMIDDMAGFMQSLEFNPTPFLFWGTLLTAIYGFSLGRRPAVKERKRNSDTFDEDSLDDDAVKLILQLKYQQSYTSGWSGALKFPIGIEAGSSVTSSVSRNQMTIPEIVIEYGAFVRKLSKFFTVIIGIDEMDKLSEDQDKFLNEIKMVFGIEGCYYLVSVSEDAMSTFERRGLPFRDVFDSCFDDIVYMDYFNFLETRNLLRRRAIGLPVPYILLCHCLSGGVPRDVIRECRHVIETGNKDIPINKVCHAVICESVRRKYRALVIAAAEIKIEPYKSQYLRWLNDLVNCFLKDPIVSLQQAANFPSSKSADKSQYASLETIEQLLHEFFTYLYYCATVIEAFQAELNEDQVNDYIKSGIFDKLSKARQFFSVTCTLVWDEVTAFRTAANLSQQVTPLNVFLR